MVAQLMQGACRLGQYTRMPIKALLLGTEYLVSMATTDANTPNPPTLFMSPLVLAFFSSLEFFSIVHSEYFSSLMSQGSAQP